MHKITIRKAAAEDLPTLLGFEQGIIQTERPFDPSLKAGHINYYDLAAMINADDAEVAVIELDDKIVGSGYAKIRISKPYEKEARHAYLGFMFIVPEHRGKGLNRMIVDYLKGWAASQQLFEIRLDVYAENSGAIKAYEKCGFTPHMLEMRMSTE